MRIGVGVGVPGAEGGGSALDGLIQDVQELERKGFASAWMANIFGLDAIGALGIAGRATQRIELGTGVVPTYPRHPIAMAQQALTSAVASNGRFTLGIGLSHQIVIENMLGLSYEKPARHMRDYLEVLGPLLRGEAVNHHGPCYQVRAQLQVPGAPRVPVLVAALGPTMLDLAGRLSDGTITWMAGARTLETHIVPRIRAAAAKAGRPAPRIVAGFPVAITAKPDEARERAAKLFAIYGQLPSYRAMLDREGAAGPADVALAGDERSLSQALARLRDVGVTDFNAAVFPVEEGSVERTIDFLASAK
jgi:F420-dependent oxidoreductase-like protein